MTTGGVMIVTHIGDNSNQQAYLIVINKHIYAITHLKINVNNLIILVKQS